MISKSLRKTTSRKLFLFLMSIFEEIDWVFSDDVSLNEWAAYLLIIISSEKFGYEKQTILFSVLI